MNKHCALFAIVFFLESFGCWRV